MDLKWVLRNDTPHLEIETLANELTISPAIARVLLNRGIADFDAARAFFRAGVMDLHDPFLFRDMDIAVTRIDQAIKNNEKIMIYGDYDVDGTTSVSMLVRIFRDIFDQSPEYYIPNRQTEGYGLSIQGVETARHAGVNLIITVDCGITGHAEIAAASVAGIDVIVTDHHEPAEDLPPALAVIDPKCRDEKYPFTELAGVGVAFKLMQALFQKRNVDPERLWPFLSLVALGSSADIVPLVDENRILVREGINYLKKEASPGLKALIEVAGLTGRTIGTGQIVFNMAPRINAVGRMSSASLAVDLLTTDDKRQAREIASVLEKENRTRKQIDEQTFIEAQSLLDDVENWDERFGLVLSSTDWHSGVIGIVASRVAEKYYRPAILIAVEDGIGKGSARSIPGFDLYAALQECTDLMLGFGGHKYAAGLQIEADKIPQLLQRFNAVARERLSAEALVPKLYIDGEVELKEIPGKFFRVLNQLAPYGPKNMRPVFIAKDLSVVGTPHVFHDKHLKFQVSQDGVVMDAIGFNLGHLKYRLAPGEKNLNLVFVIEENQYRGRTSLQLRVKDLV